jgi:hypothetical protein
MENEMYPTNKNAYVFFLGIILLGTVLFACMGCDSILPTDFKSQTYAAADIDIKAGTLLLRDTVNDLQGFTYSYQYGSLDSSGLPSATIPVTYRVLPVSWGYLNSRTLASLGLGAVTDTTDSQIILSKFDAIADSLSPLTKDGLILVKYPTGSTVSYAVLKSTQAQDVYIYTGLQYYSGNINEYVTVDLIKRDNSVLGSSTQLAPESVYSSVEKIQIQSSTRILPAINARYAVHLDQGGVYLVRFTLSNSSVGNPLARPSLTPPVPSIANQFKVVILSY